MARVIRRIRPDELHSLSVYHEEGSTAERLANEVRKSWEERDEAVAKVLELQAQLFAREKLELLGIEPAEVFKPLACSDPEIDDFLELDLLDE